VLDSIESAPFHTVDHVADREHAWGASRLSDAAERSVR
jgi:hypothetical protein